MNDSKADLDDSGKAQRLLANSNVLRLLSDLPSISFISFEDIATDFRLLMNTAPYQRISQISLVENVTNWIKNVLKHENTEGIYYFMFEGCEQRGSDWAKVRFSQDYSWVDKLWNSDCEQGLYIVSVEVNYFLEFATEECMSDYCATADYKMLNR